MSDPQRPQWEDCKVCGGDHWTSEHAARVPVSEGLRERMRRLGEHAPDDQGSFEAPCLICGERWPCESYQSLLDYATAGAALAERGTNG